MAERPTVARILSSAEELFDRRGFHAVGIDEIAAHAEVSTRTLYKHMGSKDGLICAVLDHRRERFFASLRETGGGLDSMFTGLADWFSHHGAHSCFFLRAVTEYDGTDGEVVATARRFDHQLRGEIAHHLDVDGCDADTSLIDQIAVLFDGATAAAVRMGPNAALVAGYTARQIVAHQDRDHQFTDRPPKDTT
ncbi:MAG: TetR/AcrR family transcriptional regulator [Actinomycetota bacterium]